LSGGRQAFTDPIGRSAHPVGWPYRVTWPSRARRSRAPGPCPAITASRTPTGPPAPIARTDC